MATNTTYTETQNNSGREGWTLVAGFFVFVLGSFIILELGLIPENFELVLLGLLYVGLPLLFGLINAILERTYVSSLAIGVCPLIAWIIVTIGGTFIGSIKSSLVMLIALGVGITAIGLLAALGGFAIGYIGRIAVVKYTETKTRS